MLTLRNAFGLLVAAAVIVGAIAVTVSQHATPPAFDSP
jgi:hypothetical protein